MQSGAVGKPFFAAIDGLRGAVCLLIVVFHALEAHSMSLVDSTTPVQSHGYLTVDFFFCLSGYITGYAYDDRWGKLTLGGFVIRRLIRLHPLVLAGMLVGAVCFYFQDCPLWPSIHLVPVWRTLLTLAIGITLIPIPPSMDIRGWIETHPLDGPAWTLFLEYVANFAYAVVLRRVSNITLALLTAVAAAALIHLGVTSPKGSIVGGWSLSPQHLRIAFTRLSYPFLAGLLLFRVAKPIRFKRFPFWCLLLLVGVVACPRIGGDDHQWVNGLYDALAIIFAMPIFVLIAAGAEVRGAAVNACKFAGALSYPIYITHYPGILVYTAWVARAKPTVAQACPVAAFVCVVSIAMGYAFLRWYDMPVRAWLQRRLLG